MPEDLIKSNDKIYFITEAQLGRIYSVIIEDANHEYQTGFFECIRSQTLSAHDAAIRNAVLDELGVLHGEDAKRFNEQLDHPEPLTPEARDLVIWAKEIAQATRKEKGCPYWNPDVNIYPDEPDNHCTCQFSDIRKKALTAASAIRILDLEQIISLSDALLHQFPDDLSIKMSKQQASQELKRLESLQSEITNQRSE